MSSGNAANHQAFKAALPKMSPIKTTGLNLNQWLDTLTVFLEFLNLLYLLWSGHNEIIKSPFGKGTYDCANLTKDQNNFIEPNAKYVSDASKVKEENMTPAKKQTFKQDIHHFTLSVSKKKLKTRLKACPPQQTSSTPSTAQQEEEPKPQSSEDDNEVDDSIRAELFFQSVNKAATIAPVRKINDGSDVGENIQLPTSKTNWFFMFSGVMLLLATTTKNNARNIMIVVGMVFVVVMASMTIQVGISMLKNTPEPMIHFRHVPGEANLNPNDGYGDHNHQYTSSRRRKRRSIHQHTSRPELQSSRAEPIQRTVRGSGRLHRQSSQQHCPGIPDH